MTIRGIHHVGLVVPDLDAAITFYGELLGMEVIERDRWRAPDLAVDQAVGLTGSSADGVMMRGSGSFLELWRYYEPSQVGDDPAERGAHELGRGWSSRRVLPRPFRHDHRAHGHRGGSGLAG